MGKLIVCREVGFDCDGEVRAETAEAALDIAASHVRDVHGIAEISPELVDQVVARMRDDIPATGAR